MKLLKTSSREHGFSLTELLIVIGVLAVLFAMTIPLTIPQFRRYQFSSEKNQVLTLLRRTRGTAMSNQSAQDHGLKIADSQYVVFTGPSYAERDQTKDELFSRNTAISISGMTELVFSALSGTTASTALVMFDTPYTATISINSEGRINY